MDRGIDIKATVEYVPEGQTDPKTVYVIGYLPRELASDVISHMITVSKEGNQTFDMKAVQERLTLILKGGVRRIKNFFNPETGKPEDFDTITDDVLNMVPLVRQMDLTTQILKFNFGTEENERKN